METDNPPAPHAGAKTGGPIASAVGPAHPPAQPRVAAVGVNAAKPVPRPGEAPSGNKFLYPVNTPEGQEERRKADALRKQLRRQEANRVDEPPPLPSAAPGVVSASAAPDGQQMPGVSSQVIPDFIPWTPEDVQDFTDELVELSEAKRVDQFVEFAKEAKLPTKLIERIERDAHYPASSKKGLKRAIAGVVAKWLNKSGVSARNKEEAALIFCMITIKVQGLRVKRDITALIAEETEKQKTAPKPTPAPAAAPDALALSPEPPVSHPAPIVLPDPPAPAGAKPVTAKKP